MANLTSLPGIIDILRARKARRKDVLVDSAGDLNFRWIEGGMLPEGFYMTVDGHDMMLTSGAEKTASYCIKQNDPRWFSRFMDTQYFPKSFRNYAHKRGFVVRTDGHNVTAVLPDNYAISNTVDLLEGDFLPLLESSFGQIRGGQLMQEGDGDMDIVRIVCGDNCVPGMEDRFGQHLMFMLCCSENGLDSTTTSLGLWRDASGTGTVRKSTVARWGHKSSPDNFMKKTADVVLSMAFYHNQFSQVFGELVKLKMPRSDYAEMEFSDVVNLLHRCELITERHKKNTLQYVNGLTEDGRRMETHYDLFCCLSRGAADILQSGPRLLAEQVTMELFTGAGGLNALLSKAVEK